MNNFLDAVAQWLSDPFKRADISKHDKITEEMRTLKEQSSKMLEERHFPIAATIGARRGGTHYAKQSL